MYAILQIRYLLAFSVGVLMTFAWRAQESFCLFAILAAVVVALGFWRYGWRVCTLALAFVLGAAYAALRVQMALNQQWPVQMHPQAIFVRATVDGLPEKDEWGRVRFTAKVQTENGKTHRILFHDYMGRQWQIGEVWQLKARIRAPIGTRNDTGFDREAWALVNGIDGLASVGSKREKLEESKNTHLPQKWMNAIQKYRAYISETWQNHADDYPMGSALMQALSVGNRAAFGQQMWSAFRPLGLNHLLAISGLHIGMIALFAHTIAKIILRWVPFTPSRPRDFQAAFAVLAATVYTALAGFGVPALRSLIMLSIAAWAWRSRKLMNAWQIWCLALFAVLLYRPMVVLSAGFWLSFMLVAALIWALSARIHLSKTQGAVRAQYAATLISLPLLAYGFGLFPLFSPLVNAFAVPLFTFLLVPLALLASLLPWDFLQVMAVFAAEKTMQILMWVAPLLPEMTLVQPPIALMLAGIFAVFLCLLPRGSRLLPLAAVCLLALLLYQPEKWQKGVRLTVWDVGQGLAVQIETPQHRLLFDTGTPAAESSLLPNLRAQGIRVLDDVILSHHDNDHDGGYPALKKQVAIQKLWAGQPEFYSNAQHCSTGVTWQYDDVDFEFLTPITEHPNDNELSCVLRVSYAGYAILITGDLGIAGEEMLVEQYGKDLFSDVLILGHHGSKTSSGSRFINAVHPYYAVASSGFANAFKHPHPDVQNTLSAHDVQLLRTDTQGKWQFEIQEDGIVLSHLEKQKKWWQRKPFADDFFQ